MIKISAVIITFNEEKNISRCIASVKEVADEILVVDSFSTDQTREICESYAVRFIQNKWPGYADQKNFANSQASYDHILSVDADEALSPELITSIINIKQNWQYDGYEMNRMTNYCGKWIRHGSWYPDKQLRLFDRKTGSWNGERIHERFVIKQGGKIGFLQGDLYHYSYYTISQHIKQADHFTDLTAEVAFSRGKKAGLGKIIINPAFKFIRDYFFKFGFLDGYYGYVVCKISAHATFLKYAKIRQLILQAQQSTSSHENA